METITYDLVICKDSNDCLGDHIKHIHVDSI